MMKQYKEFSFSELFYKYALNTDQTYIPKELINRTKTSKLHPFQDLFDIYESKDQISFENHSNSKETYKTFLDIKELENDAMDIFELEHCMLESKREIYLNTCIDILKNKYSIIEKENSSSIDRIIANSLRNLIITICFRNAPLITKLNFSYYNHLTTGSPEIKTFKLIIPINKDSFEKAFNDYIKGEFVSNNTSAGEFLNLFNGSEPLRKMNWIGHKNSLCYFIKQLTSKKTKNIFEPHPGLSHWDITAFFFTIQGSYITPSELINQGAPESKRILKKINSFVSIFY